LPNLAFYRAYDSFNIKEAGQVRSMGKRSEEREERHGSSVMQAASRRAVGKRIVSVNVKRGARKA
jgi:hypothetical protein